MPKIVLDTNQRACETPTMMMNMTLGDAKNMLTMLGFFGIVALVAILTFTLNLDMLAWTLTALVLFGWLVTAIADRS
jgi:hypothetical protein